jgi:hypothetical protein
MHTAGHRKVNGDSLGVKTRQAYAPRAYRIERARLSAYIAKLTEQVNVRTGRIQVLRRKSSLKRYLL